MAIAIILSTTWITKFTV